LQEGRSGRAVAECVLADTLSDAAAGIATAATRARNTMVTEARWEPYTWIRLQGSEAATDVVFAHAIPQQEGLCQAAITSH
ncbi:hypothetical protein, partial [Escherichia coli]|uniref:hypothetical protein n=1 Tax=Escherichia coli TaxID=562 RepID=UPI0028DDC2F2